MNRKLYLIVAVVMALIALLSLTGAVFADGTKTIYVNPSTLDQQGTLTDIQAWHFVITQIDNEADAPATIHVTWENGNSGDIGISDFTGGVAHYWAYANAGSRVNGATAEIYESWSGTFNLSHFVTERPPVPELSAGILFGLGLLGLGGFVLFRRNRALRVK